MIVDIVQRKHVPVEQEGEATLFKRRIPAEGNIEKVKSLEELYDYIRMLDAEGYPQAFLENELFKMEFSEASFEGNDLLAKVRITKQKGSYEK